MYLWFNILDIYLMMQVVICYIGDIISFISGRSQEFMILCENSLEEWLRNEGLEQYIPSILRHCRTGAQLAGFSLMDLEMVSFQT